MMVFKNKKALRPTRMYGTEGFCLLRVATQIADPQADRSNVL